VVVGILTITLRHGLQLFAEAFDDGESGTPAPNSRLSRPSGSLAWHQNLAC
jgi:hypothetical protein